MGLLSLRGEKSFAKTDKAVVLFFLGSELAGVILKENPISGRPWGQFFDHLINFALVTLLGSIFSELKEVEDFLAFFRVAGLSGLFSCQVVADLITILVPRSMLFSMCFTRHLFYMWDARFAQ